MENLNKKISCSLSILLIATFIISCTNLKQNRYISSMSEKGESLIIRKAYICIDKLHYINSTEVDFVKDKLALKDAFKTCLAQYIQIPTISPIGSEEKAVLFLATIFENLDIPYKTYSVKSLIAGQKLRHNIVATVSSDNRNSYDWSRKHKKKSVILTHHMDVVDAVKEQWLSPDLPFSGKIMPDKTGREFIWGRGALDMKGIGIAHLISMILLKNTSESLKHDFHYLAIADEEETSSGAIGTLKLMGKGKELHALSNAKILLNEGGGSLKDIPVKGKNLMAISTEQKGGTWLKLSRKKPNKLLKDLNKLGVLKINYKKEKHRKISKKQKCKLLSISGPKPKVNVVASQVEIKVNCQGIPKAKGGSIVSIIKKGIRPDYLKIKRKNQVYTIKIDTHSSSHGSIGIHQTAIDIMAVVLNRLKIVKLRKKRKSKIYKYKNTKATIEFIRNLKPYNKKLKAANKFRFVPFIRRLMLKNLEEELGANGVFRTNCTLTNFLFDSKKSTAYVDCRLLHTAFKYNNSSNHTQKFVKYLKRKNLLALDLKVDIISGWNFTSSSFKSKDYQAIKRILNRNDPNAIVTPFLNPSGSDSSWFRNPAMIGVTDVKGIPSYGLFPASFSVESISTIHGSNERFATDEMNKVIKNYYEILKELDKVKGK
ncbi:MAG: acetylornithine deacetylase/succinyl-diaminopimelate desuccinylase-like protein [Thermoproteota archaeon]|jgi:acetylornithine deacetylase/succinyl-diaminopimelate desuccinylase-like protein